MWPHKLSCLGRRERLVLTRRMLSRHVTLHFSLCRRSSTITAIMAQFKPGDVILTSTPFAFVILSTHRQVTRDHGWSLMSHYCRELVCAHCWTSLTAAVLTRCQSCSLVNYCSPDCREEDRQDHSQECTVLGQADSPDNISDQLRLVTKIWLKVRRKEELQFLEEGEKASKSWSGLIDHYEDLVQDSRDMLEAQYAVLKTHLKPADLPSMEEFIRIYGKILTNSFSLRSDR